MMTERKKMKNTDKHWFYLVKSDEKPWHEHENDKSMVLLIINYKHDHRNYNQIVFLNKNFCN